MSISTPITIFMTRFYYNCLPYCRRVSVYKIPFQIYSLVVLGVFLLLMNSCEADPTKIGIRLLPGSDFSAVYATDTISPFSYTWYDDSVATSNQYYGNVGITYDPYFGITKSDLITQIRLEAKWEDDIFTVDSVKLFMRFRSVKGVPDLNPSLKISEISEEINIDSTYYSNYEIGFTGYEIPEIPLPVLRTDTVNSVVLDLPVEFANYLLRDTNFLFHSNRVPDFRSYFKGLNFSLTGTSPLLLTLRLEPPAVGEYYQNYIKVYYHDEEDTEKDYSFIIDAVAGNAHYNRFSHDYDAAEPDKKIRFINEFEKDTLSYAQSMSGVYTRVLLPGLEDIKNNSDYSGISVNKARLIVPVFLDGENYTKLSIPSILMLRYTKADGEKLIVPDYIINSTFYDGIADTVNLKYSFNLVTFIQQYLEDTSDEVKPELDIVVPSGITENVILKANDSSNPVKFEFTYTKF